MSLDLSGVFIPCTTPFSSVTGEIDITALRINFKTWLTHSIKGIVVGGSTGEALLLDENERTLIITTARDLISDERLLIAGTGAESTRTTIRYCKLAAGCGADAVLVQPPAFYRGAMTDSVLLDHYLAVAKASPVPVIVYQVPLHLNTIEFSSKLLTDLSSLENIVGMKDSRGKLDIVGEIVSKTRDDFQILVGSGAIFYGGLELGAVGGILAVACLAPGPSVAIHKFFKAGNFAEAGRIQEIIGPVHKKIVGSMGVPGVKAAMDFIGLQGGKPRPPLRPSPGPSRDKILEVLESAGLDIKSE